MLPAIVTGEDSELTGSGAEPIAAKHETGRAAQVVFFDPIVRVARAAMPD